MALACSAGGAFAASAASGTGAGRALARAALLGRGDFGTGWSGGSAPRSVPALTCPAFHPSVRGALRTGAAASPPFHDATGSQAVSQTSYVFSTPAQAAAVAAAVMRRNLLSCVAQSMVAGSGHGVRFTVSRRTLFSPPRLGVRSSGYRISGTASRTDQTVGAYLDEIVLASGRTVTALSFAGLLQPFPTRLELRLARIVASRIKQR